VKGHRGNPGLKGRLLNKSVDAYILALETINRISIQYRLEAFCYLICNAWELLLKAEILATTGNDHDSIYRGKKKRGERRESLSLRECLERVIPPHTDPERRNVERVAELRDEATHLVVSEIPCEVMCLFQACVINYHKRLTGGFGMSLSERVPVGMMSIVYDIQPHESDMTSKRLQRRLGRDAAAFLSRYCSDIRREFDELQRPAEFSIGVEYRLVLTKTENDADIVLSIAPTGESISQPLMSAKDSGTSHPFRRKELLEKLKSAVPGIAINQHDIQCVNTAYRVKQRPEYFYQGRVKGSPPQYSQAFLDWLIEQYRRDKDFFQKTRTSSRSRMTLRLQTP